MKKVFRFSVAAALLAIGALVLVQCATVAPGNDPVIVNAERSEKIAFDTVDAFLTIESQNLADFEKLAPGVAKFSNKLRTALRGTCTAAPSGGCLNALPNDPRIPIAGGKDVPGLFKAWDDAIDAYRTQKTAANSTALDNAAAAVQSFITDLGPYLAQWNAAKPKTSLLFRQDPRREFLGRAA